jgi:GTPase
LDEVVGAFRDDQRTVASEDDETANFSLAIVGRPNVGKSSIVNTLCGTQRSIVTPIPGTTRDAVDTVIKWKGKEVTLIDTAGIRRKSKVDYGVEAFSVVRSISAIGRSDVVAITLDATETISDQDQKIAAKIDENGKAAVILINKWDLIEDRSSKAMNQFIENVKTELRTLAYAEVVFTSALTKQRISKILEASERAFEQTKKRITTSLLNQVINEAVALVPPPSSKRGKRMRVYYSTQVSVAPPTFVLFVNEDKLLTPNYQTYLERKIREAFGFAGTAIRVITREKAREGR